jgi:hypothetical protein
MTMTMTEALARHNLSVADEMLATIEVPVLSGPQRQGDILIVPRPALGVAELTAMTPVPRAGVAVVRGEATGNTHLLDAVQGAMLWRAAAGNTDDLVLGVLHVPDDAVAHLIHTDEHGCNGIAPGTYTLHGKREQAEEIRRVAD